MPRVAVNILSVAVGLLTLGALVAWFPRGDAPATSAGTPSATSAGASSAPATAASSDPSAASSPATSPAANAPAGNAAAAIGEPLDLVPAESLLCWYGRPFPDVTPLSGEPSALATLVQLIPRVTPLDTQGKLYARALEAFALSIAYPHVFALIDAAAKPAESDPSGRKLDRLRFAAIVQIDDKKEAEAAFGRIIQAAVNEQTDHARAALTLREAGQWRYQELRDQRLPEWTAFAWGRIGPHFVLTIGQDVWPEIAAVAAGQRPALSRAEWLGGVRGPRGRNALIEITVAMEGIRRRLDPLVGGRATEFFEAWHAGKVQRAHWAMGFEGPALYCVAYTEEEGRVRERLYADPAIREPRLLATIPNGARYAIYRFPPAQVLTRMAASWLATEQPADRQAVRQAWDEIQARNGFDAQRDLLAHLGDYIVLHNDPPHPLHLPLATTTLVEIREQPQAVRAALDALCRGYQEFWQQQAEKTGQPNLLRLEHDGDGIWYVRLPIGVAGPAWTVTDRFLISSWSPTALRAYLEKVGDRAGRRLP